MGAFTGFFSGLTLTSTAIYLSLLVHQRHRTRQSQMLSQQALLLNSIVEPKIVPVEDAPRFTVQRANWTETWKDRWNSEVEGAVRWCQSIRWDDVRAGAEGRAKAWKDGERRL